MPQRIDSVRRRLAELQVDALLVSSLANIRYLLGFTGSNAVTLITAERVLFVTDRRYEQQSHQQVQEAEILIGKRDLLAELKETRPLPDNAKCAVEAVHLTIKEYTQFKKLFPRINIVASERIVERFASFKDETEVDNIAKAGHVCGKVLTDLQPLIKPGVRELEISAEISYQAKKHGSERDPFEPIVASGKRSALPHGISSNKQIDDGDFVIVDFGAVVNGYNADFTRTFAIGEPSEEQKKMGRIIKDALELAEESAVAGMRAHVLDALVRDYLDEQGYGRFFQHSLGHGIGLEVHGIPRIGERSRDVLGVGHVVALEPGIYVQDIGGVRIEDDFVVRSKGVENLTPFPRELICVG